MPKSRFANFLIPCLATLVLLTGCQREPTRNLVLICIDTVRYDALMQTGLADALDPWLERAQIYDNAIATGPWTIPSVASTLTGYYPVEHGAGRFQDPVANLDTDSPSPLDVSAETLAETLAANGVRTGAFVAHPFFTSGLGLDQGFEDLHAAKKWSRNFEKFTAWKAKLDPSERFFGYLHFMEAHDRHKGGEKQLATWLEHLEPEVRDDVRERVSLQACREEGSRHCLQHQVYNAAVLELRTAIATILDALQRDGLMESTLVMVYSDHGEEFWEHRREQIKRDEDPRGIIGFGHGQSMYQELLHVPLLAWVPGRKGARHQALVSLIDILPSIAKWLDLETAADYSGRVLPIGKWAARKGPTDRTVYSSGIAYGPEKIATRSGSLKSVFTLRDDRFEFYDLSKDPEERQPLSESAELVMAFDTATGDYLERSASAPIASSSFSDDQIRALKAIGYLQGVQEGASSNATSEDTGSESTAAKEPDSP